MLSPSDKWKAAMLRNGSVPRFLVRIDHSSGFFLALDGPVWDHGATYPIAVNSIESIGATLDPVNRSTKVNSVTITMSYEWVATLVSTVTFAGQKAQIWLGEQNLAGSEYLLVFTGQIRDVIPLPDRQGVQFDVDSFSTIFDRTRVAFTYYDEHPLEVAESLITSAGGSVSNTSFDPSLAAYDSFGHYVVNRYIYGSSSLDNSKATQKERSIREMLDNLMLILRGSIVHDADGDFRFKPFSTTADEEWGREDIVSLEQLKVSDGIINRVTVNIANSDESEKVFDTSRGEWVDQTGETDAVYVHNDTASQALYASPVTGNDGVHNKEVNILWQAGNLARLGSAIGPLDTTIDIDTLWGATMCGDHNPSYPAAQPVWAVISATRKAWLMIEDEVVSTTTPFTEVDQGSITIRDNLLGIENLFERPTLKRYTSVTRGELGTSAVSHDSDATTKNLDPHMVRDVTIAHDIAEYLLSRFRNGEQRIVVTTGMHKAHIQQGDIIAIDWPDYLAVGQNGLTTATSWEVVRAEMDKANGIMEFEMVRAASEALTSGYNIRRSYADGNRARAARAMRDDTSFQAHLQGAVSVTDIGGRTIRIDPSVVTNSVGMVKVEDSVTKTLDASKTWHVYQDVWTGAYVFRDGTIGTPVKRQEHAYIAIVVVGASTITSIDTSVQVLTALGGEKLIEFSVDGFRVAEKAIQSFHKDPDVIYDNLIPNGEFSQATRDLAEFPPDSWQAFYTSFGFSDDGWLVQVFDKTAGAESGQRYVEIQRYAGGVSPNTASIRSERFPVAAETLYALEVRAKGNDTTSFFTLTLDGEDENGLPVGSYTIATLQFASTGVWTTFKAFDYINENFSPGGARFVRLTIRITDTSSTAGFILDVDRVSLTRAQQTSNMQCGAQNIASAVTTPLTLNITGTPNYTNIVIGTTPYGHVIAGSRYVALQPGLYSITSTIAVAAVPSGTIVEVGILINGTISERGASFTTGSAGQVRLNVGAVKDLQKDDYVQVYFYQNSGGPLALVVGSTESYLNVKRFRD